MDFGQALASSEAYFVLLALAFGAAFAWCHANATRLGLAKLAVTDVCIAALIGGIVGSRALHVAVEPLPSDPLGADGRARLAQRADALDPAGQAALREALAAPSVSAVWEFVAEMPPGEARDAAVEAARRDPAAVPARLWYRARPLELFAFWRGGLAYLGGLALAFTLGALVARRHGAPVGVMANLAGPAVPLGLAVGRVGCFVSGCCYGQVCEPRWWSAPLPFGPHAGGPPRVPTAALESLGALGIFFAVRALVRRGVAPWEGFCALLVLYAPLRFVLEALRDDPRGGAAGLSTSQWIVLATGLPAAIVWVRVRLTRRPTPAPEAPAPPAA